MTNSISLLGNPDFPTSYAQEKRSTIPRFPGLNFRANVTISHKHFMDLYRVTSSEQLFWVESRKSRERWMNWEQEKYLI